MPAARQRSRSPLIACAVIAMILVRSPVSISRARIAAVASKPPISGICTSIRITSNRVRAAASTAWRPSATTVTSCPRLESRPTATRWLTMVSSATRMRSADGAAIARGSGAADLAALRELQRVADQVRDDLPQPQRIADDRSRQVGRGVDGERELLLRRLICERPHRLLQEIGRRERHALDLQLARLDLREVQDVLQDLQPRFR